MAEGRGKEAPAAADTRERKRAADPDAGGRDGRRRSSRSRSPRHHSSKRLRRYSRSPSPAGRRGARDEARRDRNLPPPPPMLDKPEHFGVYRGRVSNVMEFGCFVELVGFRSKAEGLVHLANMAKTRRARAPPRPGCRLRFMACALS